MLFAQGAYLDVFGALSSQGTATAPVTLTSIFPAPVPGDWGGVGRSQRPPSGPGLLPVTVIDVILVAVLIVVVLTWSDAIFDLAHMILGLPHRDLDFNRTAITTAVILLLWMFSAYKIYLVVSRPSYLESFLHVCAWCRKIEHNDRWLSLEAHFAQKTGGQVSHGICPECSDKLTHPVEEVPASTGG